ncbi:S-layer homology domain-containing protein, partial [Solibacillus sp.]|uniref:S-layer homology domain-containing protein n=1 Tax=Solibacillus sp. TaxID=1909654 RepID=UPI00331564A7
MKNPKNKILNSSIAVALVASTLSAIPAATVAANGFNDLHSNNTHYDNIINLLERGIINGFPDGTFKPEQAVTRGQAAKILSSVLNLDTQNVSNPNFIDLPQTHQFYGHIAALVEAGVINGFPDGSFKQNDTVTRGQLSKMLVKAFSLTSVDHTHPFSDVSLSHEYSPYIASLYGLGVTTGKTATTYDMKSAVTRGQFASFVVRAENSKFIDKKTISGTIEKITKNYLTIDGTKYKFDSDFKFLSLASNAPALKDAAISITIKNNQLQTIDNLHILANAEKLNLQGSIINTLTLPASLELLKDVQASKISYSATPTTLKFDQVTALTVDIQQERAKTASLLPMANANQQTVATFANSSINDLHIETTQSTITNENSLISNLHALTTATLTLNGAFLNVYVTNLLQLLGTASISHLHSSANNFSTFNISSAINVLQAVVNNDTYSWSEFITKFMSNQPSNPVVVIPSNPGSNNNNVVSPPLQSIVDNSKLKVALDEASGIDQELYTVDSVTTLTSAIQAAQAILADTNASQAQVNAALTALTLAITGLVVAPVTPPVVTVDTSKLQAQLSKASALDQKLYTVDSVATLTAAITNVQAVLADTNASQAQVNDALAVLTSAITGLVVAPVVSVDTANLQAELTKASALDQSPYTADSFATLAVAITTAQAVLADTNASQAQVDNALA